VFRRSAFSLFDSAIAEPSVSVGIVDVLCLFINFFASLNHVFAVMLQFIVALCHIFDLQYIYIIVIFPKHIYYNTLSLFPLAICFKQS
jgi:hypothetical protein